MSRRALFERLAETGEEASRRRLAWCRSLLVGQAVLFFATFPFPLVGGLLGLGCYGFACLVDVRERAACHQDGSTSRWNAQYRALADVAVVAVVSVALLA